MNADVAGLLRREVTTLVFDQYGTIVDMQGGLAAAVTPFLAGKGWSGDPHRFVTWWRRTHFEDSMIDSLCGRGHTPYRQIGHRAVANVMRRAGIDYTHEEGALARLPESSGLKPFPDVLERARTTAPAIPPRDPFERRPRHARSREAAYRVRVRCGDSRWRRAGCFKPHHATYAKACERLGAGRSSVLFVANHAFDCIGAKAYGMRAAFIDRRKRPFGDSPHQPDIIVEDFAALVQLMSD